jgi:Fe-S cluster assembly iron-binding protein IscA
VKGVDNQRLAFSITLEDKVQPDDHAQSIDGLTVTIPTACAKRRDGITMGYQELGGFTFHHPAHPNELRLHLLNLN